MTKKEKITYYHESCYRVLKIHLRCLHVALILKSGKKIIGKVRFSRARNELTVNMVVISSEDPIVFYSARVNNGIRIRRAY